MSAAWNAALLCNPPFFADLCSLLRPARFADWPDATSLSSMLAAETPGGSPLRFVADPGAGGEGALAYERRTVAAGEVGLRPGTWHDLFNAFMWIVLPRSRMAISEAHLAAGDGVDGRRPPRRDALTLFDECGVVLACADERAEPLHRAHRWRDLCVRRRSLWWTRLTPMLVGHGLCEQLLKPYSGLTGKALYMSVPPAWFDQPLAVRYRQLDARLASAVRAGSVLQSTSELLPLPMLGVPGWCEANCDPAYYEDARVFRARRSQG
ncbi:MAG: DUF3025 domain-containing protein [Pseudomonadota bacterium]